MTKFNFGGDAETEQQAAALNDYLDAFHAVYSAGLPAASVATWQDRIELRDMLSTLSGAFDEGMETITRVLVALDAEFPRDFAPETSTAA